MRETALRGWSSHEDKLPCLQGQECQRHCKLPQLEVGFNGVLLCRDRTLLPYSIRSLQGYPGELVRSSSTVITLDDVLTILDKHYNSVKAVDALNQELFQLQMADKETISPGFGSFFPWSLSPWSCGRVEKRPLLWQTSQAIENDGGLPAACEAEKEDSIELPRGPRAQTTDNPPKPRTTSFFPLRKLKGNQPLLKKPAVCLEHLEEEDAGDDEDQ